MLLIKRIESCRQYSSTVLSSILKSKKTSILPKHPSKGHANHVCEPAVTRFAPSPTGMLHLGSLRTALYNYLLAKKTDGKFILRIEDTDRSRLKDGAMDNIYNSLKWCNLKWDEGPYLQSERTDIYRKHINHLIETGRAYRCFCTKERLDDLRQSALRLVPPTNVSYDRHCAHLSEGEIKSKLDQGIPFTVRFKAPEKYPPFEDLLHGKIDLQPQQNPSDIRYDDPILMKSDNYPTYHLANVIDDHDMKISHVIRGEEWLPSTPKHIALYEAFGWKPPKFTHLPLLTTTEDKKLSKRRNDMSVMSLKEQGILPEALVNFSVLFGWSPPRELASKNHECFTLQEFENLFDLDSLTKGNAKVDMKKLWFFNKHFLGKKLEDPTFIDAVLPTIVKTIRDKYENVTELEEKVKTILIENGKVLSNINEFDTVFYYFFEKPNFESNEQSQEFLSKYDNKVASTILQYTRSILSEGSLTKDLVNDLSSKFNVPKKTIFQTLRFALAGSHPGAAVPVLFKVLGVSEAQERIANAIQILEHSL